MVLGDLVPLLEQCGGDTPVLFRLRGEVSLCPDDYCEGLSATPSRMWEGKTGWRPCILVELGQVF